VNAAVFRFPMFLKRNFQPERRSHRQWINTSVQVFAGPGHMEALGVNLSDGGMCLFAIANLHVGSRIDIEYRPPHASDKVRVTGVVRHRALYLYGVEFLSDETRSRMQAAENGMMTAP